MTSYQELRKDKQIQFAERAVEIYKRESAVRSLAQDVHSKDSAAASATAAAAAGTIPANTIPVSMVASGTNIKRHIIGVDNISRINYEMIKSTPGSVPLQSTADVTAASANTSIRESAPSSASSSFSTAVSSRKRAAMYAEVEQAKTKMFKNQLFDMNDAYIAALTTARKIGQADETAAQSSTLPLDKQKEILQNIQTSLVEQYEALERDVRKWFTLRELLLDANIELDLFSEQDTRTRPAKIFGDGTGPAREVPRIKLGCINLPAAHTQSAAHTLAFSRSKRIRIAREPSNIL